VVLGVGDRPLQGGEAVAAEAGYQEAVCLPKDAFADRGDLVGSLALTEDYFRKGVAQAAVMVDLGEAEVLVRQVTELVKGSVDAERTRSDGIEEGPELVVNGWTSRNGVSRL
jgi:hypothetical protein